MVGEFTPLVKGIHHVTSVRGFDSVISPFERPLLFGETRRFVFGGPNPGPEKIRLDVTFKAALFEDGAGFGEADWVERLVKQRQCLYDNIQAALSFLSRARQANISRKQLMQEAQQLEEDKLGSPGLLRVDQSSERFHGQGRHHGVRSGGSLYAMREPSPWAA